MTVQFSPREEFKKQMVPAMRCVAGWCSEVRKEPEQLKKDLNEWISSQGLSQEFNTDLPADCLHRAGILGRRGALKTESCAQ